MWNSFVCCPEHLGMEKEKTKEHREKAYLHRGLLLLEAEDELFNYRKRPG